MKPTPISRVLRTFSANHWNQPEKSSFQHHSLFFISISQNTPILFSNAEKMRKNKSLAIKNKSLESFRTIWSNGLSILFPIIQECLNLSTSAR